QMGRDGCFSTEALLTSFNLSSFHYESQLYASAKLLEEGTGMWRTATKSCMILYETVTITFENTDVFYKPGIPYTGMMLLKSANGSALKEKEFLLVVDVRGEMQRKTLLTDRSGRASFELDTSGWNDKVSLHGELKDDPPASEHEGEQYLNYRTVTRYLYPFSSDSKSFLKIRRVEKKLPCGQPRQLGVDYFFDQKAMGMELQSLDVVFLVLAKGTIATVLRKELPAEAGLRGSFSLELPIGPKLAPMAKVLGYAVLSDGEMVADSTELKVDKCFPNKVNLSFSEQRALVGSQLRMEVQAAPGSLCAVYAMDQRTQSSGSRGKLNPSMVYNLLPAFFEDSYHFEIEEADLPRCSIDRFELLILGVPAINCFDLPRNSWKDCHHSLWRREVPESNIQPGFYSLATVRALQPSCTLLFLPGRITQEAELEEDEQASVMQDTGMQMDFLGTWLWELVPVRERGSAEVTVTVPDTITKWKAGMFCTAPQGLGLAPAITLTAFKPFFVELALPYTVVHHKAFTLVATVFNYLRQCLRVQVTLESSAELEVLAGKDRAYRGCVCTDEERTFRWSMRATSLGEVNITVIAEALRSEKLCGTEMPVVPAHGHVDTETKLLTVQVRGVAVVGLHRPL
ncbi:A2ML1 protein, partial [Chunga burmeisteri]|nr:A2ML1 protein [Chunga burmeisteri]